MTENASLQRKLEQYSLTVKGQIPTGRSAAEIAGYAAAAGAAMAMAGAADAAIIYSGIQNITVAIDPNAVATGTSFRSIQFTPIDIDGGGTDIIAGPTFGGSVFGPTPGKYTGGIYYNGAGFIATGGAQVILTANGGANFPLSFIVGPGGATAGAAYGGRIAYRSGTYYTAYNRGNFPIGVTGIAGIQLASGNFGWIRLRLDDLGLNQPFGGIVSNGQGFPDQVTIIDWAYDDSGAPIHVADTGVSQVPEPSSLVLLAAGAAGVAAFRRRKAERRV